ncbi:type IVB secretion system protein IcmH/DotU [Noviherbaspirillum aerium]|uniref:type IVB secretion system protein IcmH/DotU n=1 Tax=Noviherbaspirillum aerium TaxID=2588497 RepID=UPI00178C6114|nr:type IVB secretion system protein IcmH/DotU [Noviherbaspirillum aerium]
MQKDVAIPSLYGNTIADYREPPGAPRTLVDLLHDGFYLLLLLKNRYFPGDAASFSTDVELLLDRFEQDARQLDVSADDVYAAKYAFCAAIDEAVLGADMAIRDEWERSPLQLKLFGDQLAGEQFFKELDEVRRRGTSSVQTLEVFYMCLLTGYQGKYTLESKEKLDYLIATLDKEIAHLKGKRAVFAPFWRAPDSVAHLIKAEIPMWVIAAGFACAGMVGYAGLNWALAAQVNGTLGKYYDLVKLAPKLAHIIISLP